jgi:hypothetical protein
MKPQLHFFVFALFLLTAPPTLGQFLPKDMPNRPVTGKMSDGAKLEELERKAAHERARANYFAKAGKAYSLSSKTVNVVLPTTWNACIARLDQLNRIHQRASPIAKLIIDYEFKVIYAQAEKLR